MNELLITLMDVLKDKLEEINQYEIRIKQANSNTLALAEQVDDLTSQLNKVTTERDGLYDDLDVKDEEIKTHIARIQVLEEELTKQRRFDNPEPDETYPIADDDMVLPCDVSMKA
jgi:peptidoglycan hydrolase CwlO-like protein